ncbi:calcium-binding protein [Nocardioides sp. SYSU D00038]|uniref:calcium-binding protein n=1 Tax=Nocardioides sp. SYSU D00038 TaxID=2812554 RepID=UPI001967F4C8|nr:calcium-binding protein [Nocardioides sp. SYSU D00038]
MQRARTPVATLATNLATTLTAGLAVGLATVVTWTVAASPAEAAVVTCQGQRATIVGTPRADLITGTSGRDVIAALGGDDRVDGRGGDDLVCGGRGADRLLGGRGADRLLGGQARLGFDRGGAFLVPDVLVGGPGDDRLDVGRDRRADAGDGSDRPGWTGILDYSAAPHDVVVDLAAGRVTGVGTGTDTLVRRSGMQVRGSAHDDTLLGSVGDDWLVAGRGDDHVDGRAGDDQLVAEDLRDSAADDDVVLGGPGDDELESRRGRDELRGGGGDDSLLAWSRLPAVVHGDEGADQLVVTLTRSPGLVADGGPGSDRLELDSPAGLPVAQLPGPVVTVDRGAGQLRRSGGVVGAIAGAERFHLSGDMAWVYLGTDAVDDVEGGLDHGLRALTYGGDDVVWGTHGDDYVDAGGGTDRVTTYGGTDTCLAAEVRSGCEVLSPPAG